MIEPTHEVRILDMRLEPADALPLVLDAFRPEPVGVTAMRTDVYLDSGHFAEFLGLQARELRGARAALRGTRGVVEVRNLSVSLHARRSARGVVLFDTGLDPRGRPVDRRLAVSG